MIILNRYQFSDGMRAFFRGNNKRDHIVCRSDETFTFDNHFQFDIIKNKTLKIKYPRWNSIIQSNIKKNKGKAKL